MYTLQIGISDCGGRLMSEKEARAFITQVAPLGTMDYSLLHKRPPMIKTNYGSSWLVPPTTLVIGVVVVILLVAGIALGCYVYWMGKTFKLVTGTVKQVTKKPLSVVTSCFPECTNAPNPLHLHVLHDNTGLLRMCPKSTQQKFTQCR